MSFGGNSGSGTTTTQIPEWLQQAYQGNVSRAQGVADSPFQAYGGQMAAGENDYLKAARDQAVGSTYAGQGQLDAANKIYGEVADQSPYLNNAQQLKGQDLSGYTNPYQQQVIDQSNGEIDRQRQMMQTQNAAAATQAGAFGGSRHGIVDSENNRNFSQMMQQNTNTLLNQGYDRATGLASQDVDRRTNNDQFNSGLDMQNTALNLQGAQGLMGVAGQKQNMALQGQDALQQAGDSLAGTQQAGLDAAYSEFNRQQQDPYQKQQLLNQSVLGINAGGTQTTNSKAKGGSF